MKVLLSYGMGVDSTAIALRWLEEPAFRPFKSWDEVTLLTAQVGDEWPDTRKLVEGHLYPRLVEAGVRTVQIARNGHFEKDGIGVLADTHLPSKCHTDGLYALSQEYLDTGTLPQYATGCRRCTHKAKGVPLDAWIKDNGEEGYLHVIGYNADELKRVERGEGYTALGDLNRVMSYPLVEWEWGRKACEAYIHDVTRQWWTKSCCTFCPFATEEGVTKRFAEHQLQAAEAMFLEYQAMALNPRSTLYKKRSLKDTLLESEFSFDHAKHLLAEFISGSPWALYRVRRHVKGMSRRSVEVLDRGSKMDMAFAVEKFGRIDRGDPYWRVWLRRKGTEQPWGEELLVAMPEMVEPKTRPGFEQAWSELGDE